MRVLARLIEFLIKDLALYELSKRIWSEKHVYAGEQKSQMINHHLYCL